MKKIAFVFVAAIAASVAVSFSSCNKKAEAADSTKVDSAKVEAPAAAPADSTAAPADSIAAADSTAAPQA